MGAQDSWQLRVQCRDGDKVQGGTCGLWSAGENQGLSACEVPRNRDVLLRCHSRCGHQLQAGTWTHGRLPETVTQQLDFLTYNVFWDLQPDFAGSASPRRCYCSDQTQMSVSLGTSARPTPNSPKRFLLPGQVCWAICWDCPWPSETSLPACKVPRVPRRKADIGLIEGRHTRIPQCPQTQLLSWCGGFGADGGSWQSSAKDSATAPGRQPTLCPVPRGCHAPCHLL